MAHVGHFEGETGGRNFCIWATGDGGGRLKQCKVLLTVLFTLYTTMLLKVDDFFKILAGFPEEFKHRSSELKYSVTTSKIIKVFRYLFFWLNYLKRCYRLVQILKIGLFLRLSNV